MTVNLRTEIKKGNKWVEGNFSSENREFVYRRLAQDLISKKINQCRWIKSIKRIYLYNGYQRITITYDDNSRAIYTVES